MYVKLRSASRLVRDAYKTESDVAQEELCYRPDMKVDLDLARAVVRRRAEQAGISIITPDDQQAIRWVAYHAVAAASPLTYEEAKQRVSIYVPEVAESLIVMAAKMVGVESFLPTFGKPLMILSPGAWDDGRTLLGVYAHEEGHHNDFRWSIRQMGGVIGSTVHAAGYLIHPTLRAFYERCYSSDMTALVVLGGHTPSQAAQGVLQSIESYSLDEPGKQLFRGTVASVAASLEKHQLPGEGSPIHTTLKEYSLAGGEIPPEWQEAILK